MSTIKEKPVLFVNTAHVRNRLVKKTEEEHVRSRNPRVLILMKTVFDWSVVRLCFHS